VSDEATSNIRGASVLLAGRGVAIAINLATQVLIVRYLGQASYGAFAYAISIAALAENIAMLGLDKAVIRFVPAYHERGDAGRVLGTILFVIAVVLSLAVVAILAVLVLFGGGAHQPLTTVLLLILIALAPIQALDRIAEQLLAIFGSPRSIVIRKHLVGPTLKLSAAIAIIALDRGPEVLAALYVGAGLVGLLVYVPLLLRLLGRHGLLNMGALRTLHMPARELFAFAIPLLSIDLGNVMGNTIDAVIIEWQHGPAEVAALRAVQPTARLNELVFANFALLFMPILARLHTRGNRRAITDLYWQVAAWQAVASFPIFVLTFSLAGPLTVLLFGERYAGSAPIVAILAIGYYVNACLGQNSLTLRIFGRVRYIVVGTLGMAAMNLVLLLVLVPPLGALGAAVSNALSLIALNIYNQIGLPVAAGLPAFDRDYSRVFLSIVVAALSVAAVQLLLAPPPLIGASLAIIASMGVLRLNRAVLRVGGIFPELLRIPLVGRLLQ
jgi:O-antigen/teichoic acid export membrane protein